MSEVLNKSSYDFYYSFIYFLSIANSYNSYAKININACHSHKTIYAWGLTDVIIPNLSFSLIGP